jgi:hypothetical protein
MLGMEAVAERMAHHLVGHHPTMPCGGKKAQTVASTRRLENSLHGFHNDNRLVSLQDEGGGSRLSFLTSDTLAGMSISARREWL